MTKNEATDSGGREGMEQGVREGVNTNWSRREGVNKGGSK